MLYFFCRNNQTFFSVGNVVKPYIEHKNVIFKSNENSMFHGECADLYSFDTTLLYPYIQYVFPHIKKGLNSITTRIFVPHENEEFSYVIFSLNNTNNNSAPYQHTELVRNNEWIDIECTFDTTNDCNILFIQCPYSNEYVKGDKVTSSANSFNNFSLIFSGNSIVFVPAIATYFSRSLSFSIHSG